MHTHHKDGNTLNNNGDNVTILCRRCHMRIDGRLNNWWSFTVAHKIHNEMLQKLIK